MNEIPGQVILDQHTGFLVNQKLQPKIQHMKAPNSLGETADFFSKSLSRSKYYQNTFQQPLLGEFKQSNKMNKSTGFDKDNQGMQKKKVTVVKKNNETMPVNHFSYNNCLLFQPAEKPQSMTKEKRSIQVIKNIFEKRERIRATSAHQKKNQSKNRDIFNNSKRMHTNHSNLSANYYDDRSYILETGEDELLFENSEFPLNPVYTEPDQYQTFAITDVQNQIQQLNSLSLQGRSNISNSKQHFQRNYSSHSQVRSPINTQAYASYQRTTAPNFTNQNRSFHLPMKESQFENVQAASPYFEQWNSPPKAPQHQQNLHMQINQYVDKSKGNSTNQIIKGFQQQQLSHGQTQGQNQAVNHTNQIQGQSANNQIKNQTNSQNISINPNKESVNTNNLVTLNDKQFEVSLGDLDNSTVIDYYQQHKIASGQVLDKHQIQSQLQDQSLGVTQSIGEVKDLSSSQQMRQKSNQKVIYYNVLPIQKQQIFDEEQYQMILQAKQNYLKNGNTTHNTSGMQSKGKSPCNVAVKAQHFNYFNHQNPQNNSQIHDISTDQMQENQPSINNQPSSMSVRLDQLNMQQVDWGKIMKKEKPIHSNHELQKNSKQILRNINNSKFKFLRNASMLAQHHTKDTNKQTADNQKTSNSNSNILELSSLTQNLNYAQSINFFQTDSGFRPQTTSGATNQRPTTPQILNQNTASMQSTRKYKKTQSQSLQFQDKNNRLQSAKSTNPIQDFIQKQGDEEYQELDILRNPSQLLDPSNAKDIINTSYNQSFYLQKTASSINEGKQKSSTIRQAVTPSRYQTAVKNETTMNFIRPTSVSSKRSQLKQNHQNMEQQINSLFKELGIRNKQQPSPLRLNTFA